MSTHSFRGRVELLYGRVKDESTGVQLCSCVCMCVRERQDEKARNPVKSNDLLGQIDARQQQEQEQEQQWNNPYGVLTKHGQLFDFARDCPVQLVEGNVQGHQRRRPKDLGRNRPGQQVFMKQKVFYGMARPDMRSYGW